MTRRKDNRRMIRGAAATALLATGAQALAADGLQPLVGALGETRPIGVCSASITVLRSPVAGSTRIECAFICTSSHQSDGLAPLLAMAGSVSAAKVAAMIVDSNMIACGMWRSPN